MKFKTYFTAGLLKISVWVLFALILGSCGKNTTETFDTMSTNDLFPLVKGKYITYRLDSMVFTNSGKTTEIHRYRVRHVIDREITDNLNRPSWLVYTYITDSLGKGPWVANGSYFITPLNTKVEVIENNLRVIKIQLPVKEGFSWKGNAYLAANPFKDSYYVGNDGMTDWNFMYTTVNQKEKIGTTDIENVTTITHADEATNVPIKTDTSFALRELSFEKYAKNIGLVYKEFQVWENQPNSLGTNPPTYNPKKAGFGIKMWMIDKN